jgi:hypothetical protein
MNNEAKIIIVGTSHQLQCGTNKHSSKKIEDFKSFIRRICKEEKIKYIVEEMSNEGLSFHGVERTIPLQIANELSIPHHTTDLTTELLKDLGISDGHIMTYSMNQPTNELKNDMRELLTNKLLHPIRERYWLADILRLNTWPTLFICGDDHGDNMRDLINSIGYGPVLSWHRICPEETCNES